MLISYANGKGIESCLGTAGEGPAVPQDRERSETSTSGVFPPPPLPKSSWTGSRCPAWKSNPKGDGKSAAPATEVRGEMPAFPGLAKPEERAEPVLGKGAGSPARFVCQTTPGKAQGRGNCGTPLPRPPAPPGPAWGGQGPASIWVAGGIPPLLTPAPTASL